MKHHRHILKVAAAAWLTCLIWTGAAWADGTPSAVPAHAPEPAANASTAPPSPALNHSPLDSEPIRRSSGADHGAGGSASTHTQGMDLSRVGMALVLVIGLIFLLRWLGKRLFHQPGTGRSTRAIQVLARAPLAPKQHIVVIRVGRRVIVVGDSGSQMNPLCEISDGEEIAALLAQLQDDKSSLPAKAFSALFQRAKRDIGDGKVDEDEEESESPATDSGAAEAHDPAVEEAEHEPEDEPAVSTTRNEISGLMAKIRVLSTHFRNGPA